MHSGKFARNGEHHNARNHSGGEQRDAWAHSNEHNREAPEVDLLENPDSDNWEDLIKLWDSPDGSGGETANDPPGREDRQAPDRSVHRAMKRRNSAIWLVPLGVLIIALAVLIWCMTQYTMVGFHPYPKNAAMLDLREEDLSISQYEKLRKKLPDCVIYWNIPFQGKRYPNTTTELTITALSEEDVAALDYFTQLQTVDARGCTDYGNLHALAQRHPEVNVEYSIQLGGSEFPPTAREITLSSIEEDEVSRLAWLEDLKTVTAQGGGSIKGLRALQSYCHEKGIEFLLTLGGKATADNAQQVTIENVTEEELSLLPLLENMTQLELVNPQAAAETVLSLQTAYPSVKISWKIQIGDVTLSPDATEVDLSTVKVESLEQVEHAMSYLPGVKSLFMGEQDISHDDMAAFRDRVRDKYKVVWYIRLGKSNPIRTDITYFMPGRDCYRDNVTFTDATSYNIRYCEDLISVDVGHLGVKDVSWVATLTNLEYLILAHTAVERIDGIENCKKLKFLELDWSGIRTLDPLKGCTALEDLNIGNTWPDVSALKEMPWLKNIYMIFGSSKDAYELAQALPDTRVVASGTATVSSGWRNLPNYYAMRDALGAPYMN